MRNKSISQVRKFFTPIFKAAKKAKYLTRTDKRLSKEEKLATSIEKFGKYERSKDVL